MFMHLYRCVCDSRCCIFWLSTVTDDGVMKFTLMTKKGNKPLLKDLEIPVNSELVNTLRDSQQVRPHTCIHTHACIHQRVLHLHDLISGMCGQSIAIANSTSDTC